MRCLSVKNIGIPHTNETVFHNSNFTGNYRMHLRITRSVPYIHEGYDSSYFWLCTGVSDPALHLCHLQGSFFH
ncbi:conserved hypothetical protein [Escherichia coli O26:H11]|nr:conserved hypothetical protein [Escherichia coli O26:H11]